MRFPTIILSLALVLTGCASTIIPAKEMATQKAIYDAQTAKIVESDGATTINRFLSSITEADLDPDGYVHVVTWTNRYAAMKFYPGPGMMDTLGTHLVWVTKYSQMKQTAQDLHLKRLKGQYLALRMEQLLGLPPKGDTSGFYMELLVRPTNIFRPCRDPEINDCECARTAPTGAFNPENSTYKPMYQEIVGSTKGYPWTRMGYTWDWKASNKSHFGASEYVLQPGAIVKIVAKTPAEQWVQQQ